MSDFASSYVGKLRKRIGNDLLLLCGARAIIENSNGQILLQKRSDFGVWGLLGGNAEPNESLEQIIVREVEEEAGITILNPLPFGFASNPTRESFTYPNGDKAQHFVLNFYSNQFEGTPAIIDDESLMIDWFAPDDLPKMLPNMLESVQAYQRFCATGEFQLF